MARNKSLSLLIIYLTLGGFIACAAKQPPSKKMILAAELDRKGMEYYSQA